MLDFTHLATLFIGAVIGLAIGGIYHLVSARSAERRHNEVVAFLQRLVQAGIENGDIVPIYAGGELTELRSASGSVIVSVPSGILSIS